MDDKDLRTIQNELGWSDSQMLVFALDFICSTDNAEAFREFLVSTSPTRLADHSGKAAGTADDTIDYGHTTSDPGAALELKERPMHSEQGMKATDTFPLSWLRMLSRLDLSLQRVLWSNHGGNCVDDLDNVRDEALAVRWEQYIRPGDGSSVLDSAYLYVERMEITESWSEIRIELEDGSDEPLTAEILWKLQDGPLLDSDHPVLRERWGQ